MTGKEAYEEDVRRKPTYHTGEPRKTWDELDSVEQWSWNKDPQPREYDAVKRYGT